MAPNFRRRPTTLHNKLDTAYQTTANIAERQCRLNLVFVFDGGRKDFILEFPHQLVGLFRQAERQDGVG
jgi:uncharacterized protein (DUF2235 family)